MSGGGTGGGGNDWRPSSGGIGGEPEGQDACEIIEHTILNSPNAAIIGSLIAGAVLSVELETGPPKRLVTKDTNGNIAGAITSPRLVMLIQCIEGGYSYKAIVLSIASGRVEIEISPT